MAAGFNAHVAGRVPLLPEPVTDLTAAMPNFDRGSEKWFTVASSGYGLSLLVADKFAFGAEDGTWAGTVTSCRLLHDLFSHCACLQVLHPMGMIKSCLIVTTSSFQRVLEGLYTNSSESPQHPPLRTNTLPGASPGCHGPESEVNSLGAAEVLIYVQEYHACPFGSPE